MKRTLIIFAVCSSSALIASAHEVRPAYLELRETAPDTYDILWKVPARGGDERLAIYVRLPPDAEQLAEPRGISAGGAYLDRWRVRRQGGLAGQTISIDGLAASGTDVLVRVEHADGSTQTARLLPNQPSFAVEVTPRATQVAATYLRLGIEHILTGIDHLLYILAMLLLVKGWKRILATMTAFTATHSLTLTAAALGWVHVPQRPVEACIALSILFVASEIVRARQGRAGLTQTWPWVISFTFGLMHGFGFAGALSEVGLPPSAIPVALLFFNLGVECGQVLFVAGVFMVLIAAWHVSSRFALPRPAWAWRVPPYAIGSVAAFWCIQRIAAF